MSVVSVCPLLAAQEQQFLALLLLSADREEIVLKTEPEENYRIHLCLCVSIRTVSNSVTILHAGRTVVCHSHSAVETVEVKTAAEHVKHKHIQ